MSQHCCKEMDFFLSEGKVPVRYFSQFREYSIQLIDRDVFQDILFCPWCGRKLPHSLREKWFEHVEELIGDFEDVDDSKIPQEFRTSEWWQNLGY